jgi:hypothetical protein
VATTVPYDVGEAQRVTAPSKVMQEMLEQAAQRAEEAARAKLRPPRHPFFSGVYTYPFRLKTGIICVCLAIASVAVLVAAASVPSLPPMLIPVVCALVAIAATAVFSVASVFFTRIIESTANLQDVVDEWPEFSVVDWILQALYAINSLTCSLLPLVLIVRLLPIQPAVAYGVGLVIAVLLFPIVLLSMLEENTCMMPFSAPVWRSLTRTWWAWLLFHLSSMLLLVPLGLVGWCGFIAPSPWTMLLFVGVAMILATVYFRLLGRLAYVIGRESDKPSKDEDEGGDGA